MSKNVEERVVEMRFDNQQFERNAKESISTLQKLKQALNLDGAKKGLDEVSKATKNFSIDAMVGNISSGIDTINSRYSILGRMVSNVQQELADGLTNVANQAIKTVSALTPVSQWIQEFSSAAGLVAKSVQEMSPAANMSAGWDKYAQKTSAVQTIMNSTGKSIEEVEDQLSELMWFSDETSYSFTDMTSNVGKFTSQNIDLETSVKAMMGIANAAALAGANSTEASRAMYNISQAMGVGYMKLIDWKSIENANMATTQLKQSMIDAAVSVGTLIDEGDGLYTTLNGNEVTVTNFTEQLKDGWLNTDAMLTALKEYGGYADIVFQKATEEGLTCAEAMEALGDNYDELGVKAFKAAQEAKTFSDMVEATKDAVSSQWSRIFQEIFGKYIEAKQLWTWWANELWDVFAGPLEAVADMFAEWHEGGGYWMATEAWRLGWEGLLEIVNQVRDAWRDVFPTTTAEEFLQSTKNAMDNMKKFREFFTGNEEAHTIVDEYIEKSKELEDYANLYYAGDQRKAALEQTKKWIEDYYDDLNYMADQYYSGDREKAAYDLAKSYIDGQWQLYQTANGILEKSETRTENLSKTVKGLVSVVDIVKQALAGLKSQLIDPILKRVPDFIDFILEKTGKRGSKITDFAQILREGNVFNNFFGDTRQKIVKAYNAISEFVKKAKGLESVQKFLGYMKEFRDWLLDVPGKVLSNIVNFFRDVKKETGGITVDDSVNALDWIITKLNTFIEGVKTYWPVICGYMDDLYVGFWNAYNAAEDFFTGPDWTAFKNFVMDFVNAGWDGLTESLKTVGDFLTTFIEEKVKSGELKEWGKTAGKTVFQGLSEYFEGVDWFQFLTNLLKTGFLVKLGDSLIKIFDNLAKTTDGLKDVPGAVIKLINSLRGLAKGASRDLNASAMLKVAGAIAILVAAIWALGILPETMLDRALQAIIQIGLVITMVLLALGRYNAKKAEKALSETANFFTVLDTFAYQSGKGMKKLLARLGTSQVIKAIGKAILKIAIAIGIVVGAILLLEHYGGGSQKITETLNTIMPLFTGIATMILLLGGVSAILTGANKSVWGMAEVLEQAGKMFTRVATALLLITASIAILSYLDSKGLDVKSATVTLLLITADIVVLIGILALIGKLVTTDGLDSIGKVLMKLAGSLVIISLALIALSNFCDPDELREAAISLLIASGALALIIVAIGAFMDLSSEGGVRGTENLETLSKSILKIAAAILVIAAAAAVLAISGAGIWDVVMAVGAFVVVLAALVAAAYVVERAHLDAALGVISSLLSALGIMVASVGIGVLALAFGIQLLADNAGSIPGVFQAIGEGIVAFTTAIEEGGGSVGKFAAVMLAVAVAAAAVGFAIMKIMQGMAFVIKALGPFIATLSEHLPKLSEVLISGAALLIAGLLEYITGSMGTFVDTILKLILLAINSIAEGIMNNAAAFGAALRNVAIALVDLLIEGLAGFINLDNSKMNWLREWLGVPEAQELMDSDMASLKKGIDTNLDEIKKSVDEKGGLIATGLNLIGGSASSTADNAASTATGKNYSAKALAMLDNAPSTGKSGQKAATDYLGSFEDTLSSGVENVDLYGMMGNLADSGTDGFLGGYDPSAIYGVIDGTGATGGNLINSYIPTFKQGGENLGEGENKGLASKSGDIQNTSEGITKAGANRMDQPAYYYKSGQNNMKGFIKGVNDTAPEVYSAVQSVAKKALSTLQNTQEEQSPSKATKRSGRHFAEGFLIGIQQTADSVYKASEELGGGAIKTLGAAIQQAQKVMDGEMDFDPTIRPVLDLTNFSSGMGQMQTLMSGYHPTLSYAGIGNIPNLGSLSTMFQDNSSNEDVVQAIRELRSDIGYLGEEMGKMQVVLDSGALVGATTRQMDRSLGRVASYKARGN